MPTRMALALVRTHPLRILAPPVAIPRFTMCQAWHDCVHNNPRWLPTDAPPEKRVWRLKIYVMENDPEALRRRVAKDFPRP